MKEVVLVVNPGSTSTKVALFSRQCSEKEECVDHTLNSIGKIIDNIMDQIPYRKNVIDKKLKEWLGGNYRLIGIVGRGGLLKPVKSGVYRINDKMLNDLKSCRYGLHASNMGAILADELSKEYNIPAFIADPVTFENMLLEAKISGVPEIERKGRAHVLNVLACAREVAKNMGKSVNQVRFVVAHLGGGITIAPVDCSVIVDCNDALLGMGPFSPERAGALPTAGILNLAFSGEYTKESLEKKFSKESGLKGYLGTSNVKEILNRISSGDKYAKLIVDAMIYQVAKEIGAMATVLKGNIDAIIITGGMAKSEYIINKIKERVDFISEVVLLPGEFEMKALAESVFRVLDGIEEPKEYI